MTKQITVQMLIPLQFLHGPNEKLADLLMEFNLYLPCQLIYFRNVRSCICQTTVVAALL